MLHLCPAVMVAMLFLTTCAHPSLAARSAERENAKVRLSEREHRLLEAVNDYRDQEGLEPLEVDPILMREARRSAPRFSHVINGKWCWQRTRQAGFPGWATDDIANGYPTPEDAVQGWATSHGHAMQMRGYFKMNGRWRNYRFNRIGVGVAGRKYIAIFGRDGSSWEDESSSESDERISDAADQQSYRRS
jgi:uncharacterized protein YkwD